MSEPSNRDLVREAFDAFGRGDLEWMGAHLADDVTWHVAGNNRFSGDHQGRDTVLDLFRRAREATEGTLRFDPNDIVADAHHAVALGVGRAENTKGQHVEFNFAMVFHVVDGTATEVWDLSDVGQSTDEFFDSLPGS
jgi:ketosteroid isomerase-like protein